MEITQAKEIAKQFDRDFLGDLREDDYVSGCGTDGESIIVYLIKELPNDVVLPSIFHSLPIICRVSGEISAGPAEVDMAPLRELVASVNNSCSACKGTGGSPLNPCKSCDGSGQVRPKPNK